MNVSVYATGGEATTVFEARLIVGHPGSHVSSQPPGTYSSISTAPPAPSFGHTRIKGRPLIESLIDTDHRVIRALSVYKKGPPCLILVGRGGYLGSLFELGDVSRDSARAILYISSRVIEPLRFFLIEHHMYHFYQPAQRLTGYEPPYSLN